MKRKWIIILLLLIFLVLFSTHWFIRRQPARSFQLDDRADTYLITTKGIYTFQQEEGKLGLLNDQRANIAEYVHYFFPRARFDNRYLVFNKGWDYPYSYPIATVSLDFQTGVIQTHKTDYLAGAGVGQTANYFYTWQTYTDEAIICQFDKNGKEVQSKSYDGLLLPSGSFISDKDCILQLDAIRDWSDGFFHSQLLTIDEDDLTLLSEETIYEPENQHYRFSASFVEDNLLYTPVHSIRDMVSKEVTFSNQLLITDLETGQQEFFTLPEYAPESTTRQGDYLFIEHDPISTHKVSFSIVNTRTREMNFVNLTELLDTNLQLDGTTLQFFSLDKNGYLLFTIGNEMIYLDILNQSILDRFQLRDEEEAIYIWRVDK